MSWFYSFKDSLTTLVQSKFSSVLSILSMSVTIFFLGIFTIFIFHGWKLSQQLKSHIGMEIFLVDNISEEMVESIRQTLQPMDEIDSILYISKDKALEKLPKDMDFDVLELLGENPLPPSFRIQLKPAYHEREKVQQLQEELEQLQGVDEIIYRYDLLKAVQQYMKTIFLFSFILGSVLLIASVLLISNTIRLSILVKQDSINIMSLVGATPSFIRRPFIIAGASQGIIGATIAIGCIFLIAKLLRLFVPLLPLNFGYIPLFLLLWAFFLGITGSWVAIHRHLRL